MRATSWTFGDFIIFLVLTGACIITLAPIVHVFSVSLSGSEAVYHSSLMLYPKEPTLQAFRYIFATPTLIRSFGITVTITVAGTLLNLLFTITAAYALSKKYLPGLKVFMLIVVVIMTFNAGIVPNYLNVKAFGMINSLWAMIIPGMVNAFYLILMRNFFMDLPQEIEESARMDGAGELMVVARVVIPLSLPVIATVGLFYGVGHWNEFFKGVFYITDASKWPLQVLLKTIVFDQNFNDLTSADTTNVNIEPANVQAASIMFATVPIVLVYPFLQKYFVKGIVMGAVKG
ncbi:carbohydrate ABC transporter permease [Paenibacillus thalictri]|uniref:Carbohydrate ABC transporter permease n=1 Tax=Paenibacillus thalictri TaxID=2527873 RepID=A0A4Q9DX97_9BACL|nr:carbohydrate ABC transporter permease [Paenibacillus thalictri]TBL80462.1 carbohydrate ABC transporter permease [Paenibacillus thalictri]